MYPHCDYPKKAIFLAEEMVENKQLSIGSVSFVSHYVLVQERKIYWFVQKHSRGICVLLFANGVIIQSKLLN